MEKVVVIGSGVGGLACGALLAQKGASVTVLESHPFIGGRCAAFTRDGFVCDFGVHMFSLGNLGPHGQAARRLGVDLPFVTRHPSCRVMGRADFDFPLDIKPLPRLALLAVRLGIKPSRLPGAWKLFRALLSGRIRPDMEDLTAREYVLRYSTDPAVHVFVNCLCQLYFAVDYLTVSAAEFALCFGRMFNESAFGYPAGGCKAIPDAFAKALYRAGGRILTNTRAVNIRVENNEVQGVETKDGFFPADRVISNAGIALTAGLAGESALGREFVERAGKLRHSNPYITIQYALDRPVIPYPVVFHMPNLPAEEVFSYVQNRVPPKDPYIFMPVPSNLDPSLAPPGKQLVIAGTAAPARAGKGLCDEILDVVDAKVKELFPGLAGAVIREFRTSRADVTGLTGHPDGEAIGLAQTPDQSGPRRPRHETPVKGLYLVGADAGARGIGTEMAVASALNLADRLTGPAGS